MEIKLKSGKVLDCTVLAKSLLCLVVMSAGKYFLVSRDEIEKPDELKVNEKKA